MLLVQSSASYSLYQPKAMAWRTRQNWSASIGAGYWTISRYAWLWAYTAGMFVCQLSLNNLTFVALKGLFDVFHVKLSSSKLLNGCNFRWKLSVLAPLLFMYFTASFTKLVFRLLVLSLSIVRLHYGWTLLAILLIWQLNRLQSVLNTLARLIYLTRSN